MTEKYTAPDLKGKTIRVAAFDIKFARMHDTHADDLQMWGDFSAREHVIRYQATWPGKAKFADTLLHEVNHAIYWAYGLEDDDKEERIVSTFATAWVQVYRDSPWLLILLKRLVS